MWAVDAWLGQRRRTPFDPAGYQHGFLRVARSLFGSGSFFLQAGELAALVMYTHHTPMCVEVFARMFDEGEAQPRLQADIVTLDFGNMGVMAQGR